MQRGFLSEDPLNGLAPFDTTPMTIRRAMPLEEIDALLRAAPESRRLLYETAIVSGLRANELRNLTINHLDDERCGLRLDATWTKNRKPGFQPLPRALMMSLQTFALSGEPRKSYEKNYRRGNPKLIAPRNPLLLSRPILPAPWTATSKRLGFQRRTRKANSTSMPVELLTSTWCWSRAWQPRRKCRN